MLTNQAEEYPCQKRRWKAFSKAFILKVVKQVDRGVSRSELIEKYKMARCHGYLLVRRVGARVKSRN